MQRVNDVVARRDESHEPRDDASSKETGNNRRHLEHEDLDNILFMTPPWTLPPLTSMDFSTEKDQRGLWHSRHISGGKTFQ